MAHEYFKKTTRLYFQEKEGQAINPISKIDAEIITELTIALGKIGQSKLRLLLMQWKQSSDADLLESVIEFNLNKIAGLTGDPDEDKYRSKWVEIVDFTCKINDLISIEKDQMYCFDDSRMKYTIILNRCDEGTKIPMHANKSFKFLSPKLRDQEFISLKTRLAEYNKIQFI